ncbi:MAG: 50S ribosomal protein L24e [Candidatus Aenigmarchaeota archaeon]|nr:50S ribosomal protein L24e [Candidatus Aenigmarchaeota archaeon]
MKCAFCSKAIEEGTGMMVVDRNGKLLPFDSTKCEKNMLKLNRDSRDFKWANNQSGRK